MKIRLICLAILSLFISAASRANITFQASFGGLNGNPHVTFSAVGGKPIAGLENEYDESEDYLVTYIGVTGRKSNQIDFGQSLMIKFDSNVRMGALEVGLLFSGRDFVRHPEVAQFLVNNDIYSLIASSPGLARWYKNGRYVKDALALDGDLEQTGQFTVSAPFGDTVIKKFVAFSPFPGSNFGIVSFSTQ